jgi:hypothetical protein
LSFTEAAVVGSTFENKVVSSFLMPRAAGARNKLFMISDVGSFCGLGQRDFASLFLAGIPTSILSGQG